MKKVKTYKIIIIVVILLSVVGITYGFFASQIASGAFSNILVGTSSTDSFSFTKGNDINIVATQANFTQNGGNIEGNTTASAKLIANNDTKTATKYYSISLDISKNGYIYTSGTTPELMITVTDPSGAPVTVIDGLNYTTSGGITGFDITTRQETIYIKNNKEITTTNYTTGLTENWTIKVYFINLNSDQQANTGKIFNSTININSNEEKSLTTNNNNLYLANANKGVMNKLKVYGSSLQNGTPTPTIPVPVNSLGESTGLNITVENNKFINGFGELKDNTNFAPYTYKIDETSSTGSSFSYTSSSAQGYHLGDYAEVEPTKSYTLSADFKASNDNSLFSLGLIEFDSDKIPISPNYYQYIENTLTYLTKDLNNGDTVLYLNDVTNWLNLSSTPTYQLGLIFWNYQDSTGYKYPELTYSRNAWFNLYNYDSIDKINNTIKLNNPWDKGNVKQNTMLSQSNSGATFNYSLVGFNSSLTTNWQTKEVIISDVNNSGNANFNKFRAGTKFVKLLILFNYNNTPNTTLDISNISIRETNEKETFNIKEPLRCINNICDYLDFENNRIVRNISEKVLSNNDTWYTYPSGGNKILSYYSGVDDFKLGYNTSLSTHFQNIKWAWDVGAIGDYSDHPNSKNKYFVFGKTLNEFKNFLSDENNKGTSVTIYYQLENPRYESITLPNINTFNGTNKITISDGTMNPSKIDISYFS